MSDIFISYTRADKDRAELLADAFSGQGWSVWWDRQIPPGKSFDETIENALNSARCVIVLWSKDSVSSRWVKTEAAEGAVRGILVPVLIDKVQIPLEFKRIEAADLSDWQGTSPHPEFDHLLKTVASILGGIAPIKAKQIPTNTKLRSRRWWKTMPGLVSAKIEPGTKGRIISGILGLAFVLIGLAMHLTQKVSQTPLPSAPSSGQIKHDQPVEAPQTVPAQDTEIPISVPSTEDKEPNDHITDANLITEGTTVRGSIATKQDREFFKIKTSSSTTRVILRKLSLPGFGATVEIYDSVEDKIKGKTEFDDTPVTVSFESQADSYYYVLVKSYNYDYSGDYELTVRKE